MTYVAEILTINMKSTNISENRTEPTKTTLNS